MNFAELIFYIIESGQLHKEDIYNYSYKRVFSLYDFAFKWYLMCKHSALSPQDEFPNKVKCPDFSVLDKTKVKATFEVMIPYWKDSLIDCINELGTK